MRLYSDAFGRVRGLVYAMVGNRDDAEDILQESSVVMWQKFASFESDDPARDFPRWAVTITANHCKNFYRRRRDRGVGGLSDETLSRIARVQDGARELLELRADHLRICLQKLSRSDRVFFEGCVTRDDNLKNWAANKGLTANAAYSRLSRLRGKLHQCVERGLRREGHDA
ncbi:MAG: sigma-70 family RNA polymerase sigma factor [Planctomycetota bacterium]